MKIVINIPEKYLNSNIIDVTLFTGANNTITDVNVEDKYTEFQILPKGHGRLIDADTLYTHCGRRTTDCAGDCDSCFDNVVSIEDILKASTIIDADNNEVD